MNCISQTGCLLPLLGLSELLGGSGWREGTGGTVLLAAPPKSYTPALSPAGAQHVFAEQIPSSFFFPSHPWLRRREVGGVLRRSDSSKKVWGEDR